MVPPLVHKPVTIGLVSCIDPRTYPVPDILEGSVKAQQRPVVLGRQAQLKVLLEQITLWDDSKLKIVVGSTVVGGPREAAVVQQEFEEAGVDIVIFNMATWSMGWGTQFFGHPEWITAHVAVNGTAWPGAVLLNSLRASATTHGQQVFSIYPPDVEEKGSDVHPYTVRRLNQFVLAAAAVVIMRGSTYDSIGHISMEIQGCEVPSDVLHRRFGMKLQHHDQIEVLARIQKGMFDPAEADRATAWFFQQFAGRIDPREKRNPAAVRTLVREWLVPMTLVVRGMMRGDPYIKDEERSQGCNALCAGTAGQRWWTDHYPNWDFTEAMLTSCYDWNGARPPITVATENDVLQGLGMAMGSIITGGRGSLFADLRTFWSVPKIQAVSGCNIADIAPTGLLHLINSGSFSTNWATDPRIADPAEYMQKAIAGTVWEPAELGYFPNDGLSSHGLTPADIPVTLLRLNRIGSDVTFTVVEGHTINLPEPAYKHVRGTTNPTWPDTFVVPEHVDLAQVIARNDIFALRDALTRAVSAYDYMNRGNDPNHVVGVPGHVGAILRMIACILRIPVDYHNIPDSDVLLPTLWTRAGGDREACKLLGPRYA